MKYINSFFKQFGNLMSYLNKHQLGIQSNLFWLIALFNLKNDNFWLFAIAAIAFRGFQIIIDELRNNQN